ncbi:MAG: MAPEG family protein [Deltaproteobacteria bacterium]|nr:MAPEG family protein [Deltaproteobacteria bacterium]
MGATATALIGFAGWFALLTIVLGLYRVGLVLSGQKQANTFATNGADLAPIGHRLTRARDNCFETLPLFAALALGASISGRLSVTDPLAMWVLYARLGQSLTHILSTSVPAVQLRATLFFAQMFIYAWWAIRLLG